MSTTNTSTDENRTATAANAEKSTPVAILLAVFVSPLAYYYVGRTKLAVINLLTFNYLLLGIVIVPIHVYKIIANAEKNAGESGENR